MGGRPKLSWALSGAPPDKSRQKVVLSRHQPLFPGNDGCLHPRSWPPAPSRFACGSMVAMATSWFICGSPRGEASGGMDYRRSTASEIPRSAETQRRHEQQLWSARSRAEISAQPHTLTSRAVIFSDSVAQRSRNQESRTRHRQLTAAATDARKPDVLERAFARPGTHTAPISGKPRSRLLCWPARAHWRGENRNHSGPLCFRWRQCQP
jgi:hypothetical protein